MVELKERLVDQPIRIPNYDTLLEMLTSSYDSFSNSSSPLGEKLTSTIEKKMETEIDIQEIYENILNAGSDNFPILERKKHLFFIDKFLSNPLPSGFVKLDASQPWICYWLMNAMILLGGELTNLERKDDSIKILSYFNQTSNEIGGFGGGNGLLKFENPHLAPTYASIMSLALIGNEDIWNKIDRKSIKNWLLSLKNPNGSFKMTINGESDTRSVYCALCVSSILNILDENLTKNVIDWILKCQTYEGGFSGEPGDEAHGGYTFCALASLFILMRPQEILNSNLNLKTLIKWTVDRQYSLEGGFSGRSNKLVDGCYSHWIGGTISLLEILINLDSNTNQETFKTLIDRERLQNYILCCCQDSFGLRDKPGCRSDFYHTNYVLCGLSMCQHLQFYNQDLASLRDNPFAFTSESINRKEIVDVKETNQVKALNPVFGVPSEFANKLFDFCKVRPLI